MISEISGLMIFQKLSLSCSRSSFYFIQSDRFKSSEKAIWCVNRFRYIKKQLHRLIFTENMLIGILSIFSACSLDLSFRNFSY